MSREKQGFEGGRWLAQAEADLRAARSSMTAGHHEWACFQAQQAGEKALKALWIASDLDPWGHSIVRLMQEFPEDRAPWLAGLISDAKELDKLYIPTRYPNGLPDLTPADVYTEADAQSACAAAERIIRGVTNALK